MGRAPPGSTYLGNAKAAGLVDQDIAQVEVPWAAAISRQAAPGRHLRSHLIAFTTNSNTTVHCDITFRGFKDGVVYLNMKGACAGCPSSTATLQHGIQNLLKHFVPDVVEVRPM